MEFSKFQIRCIRPLVQRASKSSVTILSTKSAKFCKIIASEKNMPKNNWELSNKLLKLPKNSY